MSSNRQKLQSESFHVFCQPSLLWTENKLFNTTFTNVPLHSSPQASTSTAIIGFRCHLLPLPPPQPLPKNFHGYAAIKNYFVGLNIFFTGLNWHYHIHPILNGQQNKTTNKIELQHIIILIYIMKATLPHALYCTFSSLTWWKLSLEELLKKAFTDVFQSTVYLGCFLLHPFC